MRLLCVFFFLWGAVAGEMLMIAGPLGPARECGTTKVNEEFLSSLKERMKTRRENGHHLGKIDSKKTGPPR